MGRLAFLVVLLFSVATSAAGPSEGAFIRDGQLDLVALLPTPPAPGSPENLAEIRTMLQIQKDRTPEMEAESNSDLQEDVWTLAGRLLGPGFTAQALPATARLFAAVVEDQEILTAAPKSHFARKRPFLVDSEIKPCVPMPKSPSYPSGHSTVAHLMGIVLAAELPEDKDRIFDRVEQFARARVVGGVHFPSDVEAGKIAGTAMAAVMMNDPAFKAAFAQSRAELRQALHRP